MELEPSYIQEINQRAEPVERQVKAISHPHTICRVCGGTNLVKYLDLGQMPLSNSLANTREESLLTLRFPLQVMFCEDCFLSQLSVVIDPEVMFSNYLYRSSINKGYVDHCRQMAKDLKKKYSLNQASFMVDIAGNDCALLKEFQSEIGLKVLNVDPAKNLAKICVDQSIETVNKFWGFEAALNIYNTYGQADLITATNVFAHCDDVKGFLQAVKLLLKPDGALVLEMPYLIDFIENNEFDTVYFEHLSYFSVTPLVILCEQIGLRVWEVERQSIHGGSIRVTIGFPEGAMTPTVQQFMDWEKDLGFNNKEIYLDWATKVKDTAWNFKNGLFKLLHTGGIAGTTSTGVKIAGFAASAKGNTLLNFSSTSYDIIEYIVDETPEKKGKYSPGTGIEVVGMEHLKKHPPDYLVVLSWNFKTEIMLKCRDMGFEGKFIIPIPEFEVI